MKTKNRISAAAFLAAASLTFSSPAWSLGLGDVRVESFLNQPLQVRIDLVTRETDDLTAVTAQLASADDYQLIGASRDVIPVPIRFTVEDIEGEPYLQATSNLPISNPVVRLIVELNYASGRLLREYTVFLDPPTFAEQAPIPRIDKRKNPPVAAPAPVTSPAAAEPKETPVAQPSDSAPMRAEPGEGEYGPVGNGETLWGIAKNWSRGSGLELNKVMIAIQRENPEAFLKGNINLLKRGAILRMPSADNVRNISTAAAISEVSAQTEQFKGGRASKMAASTSTPLLAEETDSFTQAEPVVPDAAPAEPAVEEAEAPVVEEVETAVVEEAEEAVVETESEAESELLADQEPVMEDQLELVPPSAESDLDSAYGFEESQDEIADASVNTATLRESLARTEEDLITQQQQNEYLADRIEELEAQLATADDGNVKDADLANMEDRLRQERIDQAASEEAAKPWYSKFSAWLIGLLVLVAAGGGWLLSRRGGAQEFVSDQASGEEQIKEIKGEAEDLLRVLEDSDSPVEETAEEAEKEVADEKPAAKTFEASGDDAEVLDEESSDPEIQLDLARAYISMGDKEAARVILEEVSNNGNEAQRDEAKKMLDLLVS